MHWSTHGEIEDEAPKEEEQRPTSKAVHARASNAEGEDLRASTSLVAETASRHRLGDHRPRRPLAVG